MSACVECPRPAIVAGLCSNHLHITIPACAVCSISPARYASLIDHQLVDLCRACWGRHHRSLLNPDNIPRGTHD